MYNNRSAALIGMMIAWGSQGLYGKSINKLEGINIEKEYKLIQKKKSGLSKSMRDLVVSEYKNF